VFAAVFGLVHGAGFANYLRSLFVDRVAVPLLDSTSALEVGQLIVIALAFVSFALSTESFRRGIRGATCRDPTRVVRMRRSRYRRS
jgi:hypothetical protein